MLVANSFDLWQKDAFFSAAEEVQKSADIMESAYRTWVRARREGLIPGQLDELGRELQMALGTAKWQLEELERAVLLSYKSHKDHITINRHSQFVSAIEGQITHVEKAFKESFSSEGKKPFRWVNLNAEECDDLALFLSGTSSQMTMEGKYNTKEDSYGIQMPNQGKLPQEVAAGNEDDIGCQVDRSASNPRRWVPQEKGTLEIVVIDGDGDGEKSRNNTQLRIASWFNQRLRGGHRSQRQQQVSPVVLVNSIRFVLALMLTIFLVVPFLVFST